MDEQRIREIAREEIAAHKEQQENKGVILSEDHKWKCEAGISTPV